MHFRELICRWRTSTARYVVRNIAFDTIVIIGSSDLCLSCSDCRVETAPPHSSSSPMKSFLFSKPTSLKLPDGAQTRIQGRGALWYDYSRFLEKVKVTRNYEMSLFLPEIGSRTKFSKMSEEVLCTEVTYHFKSNYSYKSLLFCRPNFNFSQIVACLPLLALQNGGTTSLLADSLFMRLSQEYARSAVCRITYSMRE